MAKKDPVLTSINNLVPQFKYAFEKAESYNFPPGYASAEQILVCGMGGSALGAEALRTLVQDQLKIPFAIVRDYHLPAYVNEKTLVVLISYSGTTEEVLSCAEEAVRKNTLVIGISSNGELKELMKKNSKPSLVFETSLNPAGQPRSGLGLSLGMFWGALVKLGFLNKPEIAEILPRWSSLAQKTRNKLIIFVSSGFLEGACRAGRNIINETAKTYADYHILPEMNHHLLEGLACPASNKKNLVFLFLESEFYEPKILTRLKLTREVVRKNKIKTITVKLKGKNRAEQMLETIFNASRLSCQLSKIYRVDPLSIPWVKWFKGRLAEK
ncbi:MAG: hypothetical protein COT34_01490 [Candidatus Nealsonbacteria bacterium CG08_land_8_20_14_0_20_43_11]|uniref:SIS domain-containing protein n=1 Tax=Candidatus Nealsonbacteria bacterium CG08_land_8_20_14_0_20_43_11 TaxID=1974706 RepID=A0A2M6T147_9BACT|nr:MAG: hypothetical protein COT34_01490 [Candidatus Nealsonbacteria bacterium CG08_land_8_20_14_0_20_43_11]